MSDRDESTERDEAAGDESSPSESRRQQAEKASREDEDPAAAGDAGHEGTTTSRPRGHTEDPDVTL